MIIRLKRRLALQSGHQRGCCREQTNIAHPGGVVAYLTTLGTGCTSSGQVGEVKEIGPGSYSIGVSRANGMLQGDEALKATVDKAGEYCHAKGQKLSNARAIDNRITFRCVSGEPKPQ